MKLPSKIKIGGHNYKIRYPYIFDKDNLTGQYCPETDEIKIKQITLSGAIQSETSQILSFFHEILHAINGIYCMYNLGKECNTEDLIDALSEGIYQVLIDNPELREII